MGWVFIIYQRYATITASGAAVPEKVLTNKDLERILGHVDDFPDTGTSDEWIFHRTGIKERRIVSEGENTKTLAIQAAKNLFDSYDVPYGKVQHVIVAHNTPPEFVNFPSVAHSVAGALGLKCGAADIQVGCSGFGYALSYANSLIRDNVYDCVLVGGVDCLSQITDYSDRETCVLFGDLGAFVMLEASGRPGIINSYMSSDPDTRGLLTEVRKKGRKLAWKNGRFELGDEVEQNYICMHGKRVYAFAVGAIIECVEKVLEGTEYELGDIDLFVPHQANMRMIESVSDKLGLPLEKFYMNIDRFGNTSTASYPFAIHDAVSKGLIKNDDLILTLVFGAGLSKGATLMRWNNNVDS